MMRKFIAITLICMCAASVSIVQDKQPKPKAQPCTEKVVAANKGKSTKDHKSWEKQVKENEKKWRKHIA